MPRPRDIVMNQHDPKALHDHAVARAIKLHKPFTIVDGSLIEDCDYKYAVVYQAPLGGDRKIVAYKNRRSAANEIRDLLAGAWAEGYYSSGRV